LLANARHDEVRFEGAGKDRCRGLRTQSRSYISQREVEQDVKIAAKLRSTARRVSSLVIGSIVTEGASSEKSSTNAPSEITKDDVEREENTP
jgi:hypothetical protein